MSVQQLQRSYLGRQSSLVILMYLASYSECILYQDVCLLLLELGISRYC